MLELGLNVPGAKSICHVLRLSKHIMNHGVNNIQGAGHKEEGDLGHEASPSLGHYAALSFVVRGKGPSPCGFLISNSDLKILVHFRHFRTF
jgi:hypothetical protein